VARNSITLAQILDGTQSAQRDLFRPVAIAGAAARDDRLHNPGQR
jgi:hypothetical protein